MSYQVIALKWRPQNFQTMIGQKHISQTLENALKTERLPQAMLFTGPRGTGKTSTARILAKSLRCQNLKDFTPCGQCSECQDIAIGRSLDVVEIDGASNNGVDSIRELRDSVGFRPSSGDKKVYIIDEVHMLSISAFNALLKTLEEPPEHVVFILATTEVHKIPKTILSRCHRFDFRKISVQDVANYLEKICKAEEVQFESEALWAIARQGQGSVRDSLSYLDQVITYSEKNVTYESVRESLGLTDRRLLSQIMKEILSHQQDEVMASISNIFSTGTDINVIAQDLLEDFKNLLVIRSSKNPKDYLDLPESEIQLLNEVSQTVSEAHLHLLFDMMLKLTQDLFRTQDQKTVLEVGLLKLCLYPQVLDLQTETSEASEKNTPKPQPTYSQEAAPKLKITHKKIYLKEVPHKVSPSQASPDHKAVESKKVEAKTNDLKAIEQNDLEPKTTESKPVEQKATEPKAKVTLSPEQKKWDDFVGKIKRMNVKTGATLQNCLYALEGNKVRLAAPQKATFLKEDIAKPDFQKIMTNYVRTFLGPDYSLEIVESLQAESQQPATLINQKAEFEKKQKEAVMKEIQESAAIQNLKKTFKDIEIISVKETDS